MYKAKHRASGKTVALKVLNPSHDASRMHREAKALSALHHQGIARIHESGTIDKHSFIATQWIEGKSLKRVINEEFPNDGQNTIGRTLQIGRQIADALQYAHGRDVVHGDLSPTNILLAESDEVTVIDFGIGRISSDATVTASGDLAGTPRYLAPEVIKGASPSPASDQYAFALLIYEMLSGHWPFESSPTAATALHHQLYSTPAALQENLPGIPKRADAVILKALNKSPSDRYDCVETFFNQFAKSLSAPYDQKFSSLHKAGMAAMITALSLGGWWLMSAGKYNHTAFADEAACNLYNNSDFNRELAQNFYQDPDNPLMASRVQRAAIESSPVMQLGNNNVYGMYAVIIGIDAGRNYQFSADLWFDEYIHRAKLSIVWLDSEWQEIQGEDSLLEIAEKSDGRYAIQNATPPANAHHAVPTIFKDASQGLVFADNVVFAPSDGTCD